MCDRAWGTHEEECMDLTVRESVFVCVWAGMRKWVGISAKYLLYFRLRHQAKVKSFLP